MALIVAGVGSGLSGSGSSAAATGAGTGAAARSGDVDGGRRLGLVLAAWRSSSALVRRSNRLCSRRGFFFGRSRFRAHLSSRFSCRLPRLRSLPLRRQQWPRPCFFSSDIFSTSGPSSSPVQVDAEAQAGAAQVDHVALVVGELVPEHDRAPDVEHVALVGVRLRDVAHALLADDLGDDVVAQRPHHVGRVGQAAAAASA